MPATVCSEYSSDAVSTSDVESGYVSGRSSQDSSPEIHFTNPHLVFLNRQLQNLEPQGALSSLKISGCTSN
jgi:phosphoadenosine phosphosulfate reductase